MSNSQEIRGHIVFDCDGTLISSTEAIYHGVAQVMSITLNREVDLKEVRQKYNPDLLKLAQAFGLDPLKDPSLKESLLKTWEEVASKQKVDFLLFPQIKELLLKLKSLDYELYVWTARDRRSTLRILKELDVAKHFLDFRCVDDCDPKPMTQGLEQMLGDIPKDKILVIGDSYTDIVGAQRFGCAGVAACWADDRLESILSDYGPQALAKVPLDCVKIIKKLID